MQHHEIIDEEEEKSGDQDQNSTIHEDPAPLRNLDIVMEDLGFGKFQVFTYSVIGLGINATGFWFYILGFLYQEPAYSCVTTPDNAA